MKPYNADTTLADLAATQRDKEQARTEILANLDSLAGASEAATQPDAQRLATYEQVCHAVAIYLRTEDAAEGALRLALLAFASAADAADVEALALAPVTS
jgi:hypothetical protein